MVRTGKQVREHEGGYILLFILVFSGTFLVVLFGLVAYLTEHGIDHTHRVCQEKSRAIAESSISEILWAIDTGAVDLETLEYPHIVTEGLKNFDTPYRVLESVVTIDHHGVEGQYDIWSSARACSSVANPFLIHGIYYAGTNSFLLQGDPRCKDRSSHYKP